MIPGAELGPKPFPATGLPQPQPGTLSPLQGVPSVGDGGTVSTKAPPPSQNQPGVAGLGVGAQE